MKILVGLSGGIDSAATALRLLKAGHTVAGAFLRLHPDSDEAGAKHVAKKLGIELYVIDASARFEETVIRDFCTQYAAGRTPNPCVLCNREMKLPLLCETARTMGFDRAATGHYAKLNEENGRFFIGAGIDESRDQSYFLWNVRQETLSKLCFPLSDAQKTRLYEEAGDLIPPSTKESREVCFIPRDDRVLFLEQHLTETEKLSGAFTDLSGNVIGKHQGLYRYTVGQRRGFGVGFGERRYVCKIDPETQSVVLGSAGDCQSAGCALSSLNFQRLPESDGEYRGFARVRYRSRLIPAAVCVLGDTAKLRFAPGERAITAPGQSAVLYDETGAILLGGVIEKPLESASSD